MKVALVSSHPAFPANEGNRSRIQQLARAVMQLGHELTFILLPVAASDTDHAAHEAAFGPGRYVRIAASPPRERPPQRNWPGKWTLQQLCKGPGLARARLGRTPSGRWVLRQVDRANYGGRRVLGLEHPYYSPLDALFDPAWAGQLAAAGKDADAVIVEYVFHSGAFASFPASALRLLDTHDAFANRHRSYLARGVNDYWLSLRPQDENAGFRRADIVLAIQPEEAQRFRAQLACTAGEGGPELVVVSHLLRADGGPVQCGANDAALLVASDNAANRHSVDSFVRHVLPRVVRERPAFSLQLAGSICKEVPDQPNVVKLGWVADLKAAFAAAPLAVNPVLVGTGINIKLLEAMAAGVPTVSTATGVRGLAPAYRNGLVTVPDDDPAAFAAAIVRCARDAVLRRELGCAALEDARRWDAEQVMALGRCLARRRDFGPVPEPAPARALLQRSDRP